jgi:hypothetical protein
MFAVTEEHVFYQRELDVAQPSVVHTTSGFGAKMVPS